jgi:pantetheine-phosphate adenylyltransferase
MKPGAIFPGSFDPLTLGHQDLIERAARVFQDVVVAVAEDTTGKRTLFTVGERVAMVETAVAGLSNVRVEAFSGLLVDYALRCGRTTLVRGIRAFSDFEYECQMALMNRKMHADIETVFLLPREEYRLVSSSWVREVARLGGDVSAFVLPHVREALEDKVRDAPAGGVP